MRNSLSRDGWPGGICPLAIPYPGDGIILGVHGYMDANPGFIEGINGISTALTEHGG